MGGRNPDRFWGYDVSPVAPLARKVDALYDSIQPRGDDPMTDFDERDLVRLAEQAGFPDLSLELQVTVKNSKKPARWEQFLRTAGNPLIPSVAEAIDRTLSSDEAAEFSAHLRPLVESGTGQERMVVAYLTAVK